MKWDYAERRRRERNYRVMFKSALAFLAVGILIAMLGGVARMVVAPGNPWLSIGLLMAIFGGLSAYLTVNSTVKIIEMDMEEGLRVG